MLSSAFILILAFLNCGADVEGSELNPSCQNSKDPQAILGLVEYTNTSKAEENPIRFALYSDRTAIYRDRKNSHGGFLTGKVDDEAWQTFEKIVNGLTAVKSNFAFTDAEKQQGSTIIFKDGKLNREFSIYGPISARKTGSGPAAKYSTSEPATKVVSPYYSGGEVPQSVIGAWYETHYFVPLDVRKWEPDYFEAYLYYQEKRGKNTVSWPANWPQITGSKPEDYWNGHSIKLPGKYLAEFEKLFRKPGTMTTMAGHTFVVSHTIPLPSENQLLAASPVGVAEPEPRQPLLPSDFLEKTNLSDIKKIARERAYDVHRIEGPVSGSVKFVRPADVIEELCQSTDVKSVDVGLELTIEAKRSPLHVASMIASTHSPESAKALIVQHIADRKFLEIITPLIQECVIRGADYETVAPIKAFWQELKKENNTLACLPLHRLEIEQTVSLPEYRVSGSVTQCPSTSVQEKPEKQHAPQAVSGKSFTTTSLPINEEAVARCVSTWTKGSNGKIEAKLFETSQIISAADVSAKQLLKLRLECLAGSTPGEVKVDAVPPETIFALMFGTASNGGAYSGGEKGAYGRLAAWQSLAALTGIDASGTIQDIDSAVKQSHWYLFSSKAKWFYNIAWDVGIVCLRADNRRLAIFASTDQD